MADLIERPWRCDVTGNPVDTDTRMIGAPPCDCQGCRAAAQIAATGEFLDLMNNQFEAQANATAAIIDAWKAKVGDLKAALSQEREAREKAEKELAEIKALSEQWMEETGSAYAYVSIRDYAFARESLAEAKREIDRCHARLEIDHHFVMVGDDKLERREVPMEERPDEVDGIEARDCTIALQDDRIATLEKALEPFAAQADRYDPPEDDDNVGIWGGTSITLGMLRAARAALSSSKQRDGE